MTSAANSKLTVLDGPSAGQTFELTETTAIIGREKSNKIVISAPGVSRRHAQITLQDTLYYLEDLQSSNGTFVNGERLTERRVLKAGDKIGLGRAVSLRFDVPVAEATRIGQPKAESQDYAPTIFESPDVAPQEPDLPEIAVSIGGAAPQTYQLSDYQVTVGRADDNDIVLNSQIVSRYHARLVKVEGGYQVEVSPKASNPLNYNNRPLTQPLRLSHGDVLSIGSSDSDMRVKIVYQAPAEVRQTPHTRVQQKQAGDVMETMMADDFVIPTTLAPPQFQVAIAGNPPRTYDLTKSQITIGRAPDNDIVIDSKIVSRHHARLERQADGFQLVPFPEAGNPVNYQGRPVSGSLRLKHNDQLRIGGLDPGLMVTMTYHSPTEAVAVEEAQTVDIGDSGLITIGRDATNDVVLDIPVVSRFHAQVEKVGQRYRVRDLRSSNGTFVNDQRIEGDVWLKPDDSIRVGPYRFVMGQDQLAQYDESAGLQVDAVGLNKWVRKDLNILQNISLVFRPREFIVVVGQSGGGKSTLVDAIAGYRPATHGTVHVNEINVYQNFDAIRNNIGFVPQRDIIHMELSVFQALDYAAQLRMPPDTTKEERHKRINEVLEDLDLAHRKDVQISGLSGGQQKRVSIGVELLTKPGLFFLDEPTSGLDPGTETALMQLMRRLADQGRTIILVTHATKNVMLADKVVFLARGGHLAWFGPPDEALEYFDQYRSERDRRARDIEFDEIYAILGESSMGEPQDWGERYLQHPAYQQYVGQPLQEIAQEQAASRSDGRTPDARPKPRRRRQVSSIRQFAILSSRNIKILTRDRFSLILMLAAAPIVSMLDVILSVVLGRNPFHFEVGLMPNVLITLFLLTVYGVMVGGLAQMREIVKEQDIYKRERLVNLRIVPYVLSKTWFAALLALYIAAVYSIVHYLAFDMPGSWLEFGIIYASLALATMAGMMLGLFASAVAPNPNSAPLIVILLMLPQIVLGGALVPLPEMISAPTSTRWAFEAFMAATGSGSDVAADACWQLPEDQLEQALSAPIAQKDELCNCMGTNAVREESCNFPGNGAFYTEAIDEPPPVPPGDPPERPADRPVEPELPPRPEEPADDTDFVALSEYRDALRVWEAEAQEIQDGYRAEIAAYEAEVQIYQAELEAYQAEVIDYQTENALWEAERLEAVVPAENVIAQFNRDFGWTFVNKEDDAAYWGTITTTWIAQLFIIGVLFVAILILQKRKDVN